MFDKLIQRLVAAIAIRVSEEIIKSLPDLIDQFADRAVTILPDSSEKIADTIIETLLARLPFPFKR